MVPRPVGDGVRLDGHTLARGVGRLHDLVQGGHPVHLARRAAHLLDDGRALPGALRGAGVQGGDSRGDALDAAGRGDGRRARGAGGRQEQRAADRHPHGAASGGGRRHARLARPHGAPRPAQPVRGARPARAGGYDVRDGQANRLHPLDLARVELPRRRRRRLRAHGARAAARPLRVLARLLLRDRRPLHAGRGRPGHAGPLHLQGGAAAAQLAWSGQEGLPRRHHAAGLVAHRAAMARQLRGGHDNAARAARAQALPHLQAGADARLQRPAQQDRRGRRREEEAAREEEPLRRQARRPVDGM
mmetsp:Transcript_12869/g.30440  ORF Transcript_12869/g.30440 Transcript_12869/m.30440 type:complete len:303 (+) Transcript_12869:530-1438(+)